MAAGDLNSMALVRTEWEEPTLKGYAREVTIGEATMFVAPSLGGPPAAYQWQLNGRDLAGATARAYSLPSVSWADAGTYRVVISNVFGVTVGPPMSLTPRRAALRFDTSAGSFGLTPDGLRLRLVGASGSGSLVVEISEDLLLWQPVWTNPPVIGAVEFLDPGVTSRPQTFYRARELQSP